MIPINNIYPYCTCIVHITIPHFRWLNRWNHRCRQKRCLRSSFCTSMLEAAGRSQVPWDLRATRCGRRYLEGQWSSLSCASYWELHMSPYVIQYHSPIIHYSQFCWVKTINSMAHLMNWATDVFFCWLPPLSGTNADTVILARSPQRLTCPNKNNDHR